MNTNALDDIRERYEYGIEVYVDSERQVVSARSKRKTLNSGSNWVIDNNDLDLSDLMFERLSL